MRSGAQESSLLLFQAPTIRLLQPTLTDGDAMLLSRPSPLGLAHSLQVLRLATAAHNRLRKRLQVKRSRGCFGHAASRGPSA